MQVLLSTLQYEFQGVNAWLISANGGSFRIPGATQPNSVWTYDFVHDRLANGNSLKMLCVLDEHTRECLAIEVEKSLCSSQDVILTLSRLMRLYGKPSFCGKLQWQAVRRMSESGMVRDAARGEAINREMAAVL